MAIKETGGNNRQYPKLTTLRSASSAVEALTGKLVRDPQAIQTSSAKGTQVGINRLMLDRVSHNTAQDVIDSDSISQLLPDIELTEQILVGSILDPKNMSTANTTFVTAENQFDSELAHPMLDVIETHFKHDYKIDDRLDIVLEEALMTKGAHILAVLPENNLDMIINGGQRLSMEAFNTVLTRLKNDQPLGFLGHPTESRVSMETFNGDYSSASKIMAGDKRNIALPFVTVTDNFNALKSPDFKKRRRELAISSRIRKFSASMEAATANIDRGIVDASKGLSSEQIDKLYQRNTQRQNQAHVLVSQPYMERPPVGHPLVLNLPIESVVPVYVPGKPDEHVGYFVLIDQYGRPVVRSNNKDFYGEMRTSFQANQKDNSSDLLRMTRQAMGINQEETLEIEQIHQTYNNILVNDLHNRLRNGLYDEDLEIGFTEEIQRVMLYRSFKAQNTQLLYIPAELVTYIAFNFNKDGIGQTLLARSKILANMRSVLLFAETMAGVRNAIGRKKVNINIDPDDTDPEKTISDIQTLVLESAHRGFPLGAPDPSQSLDFLNRAGFDFAINVDSDTYGQTKVEYDDYTSQIQAGNPDLQDRLRRMHTSGMGLPPDIADPTQTPDFAVSVVNNNLILTRRVKRYQKFLTQAMSKFVRCYTAHSSKLLQDLAAVVEENRTKLSPEQKDMSTEDIVADFIASIELQLPEPDNTSHEQNLDAVEKYSSILDKALESYITADLFPEDALGGASGIVDKTLAQIKAYFMRQFLARNNILPELDILTRMDEGKPAFSILDIQLNHVESLGAAMQEFAHGLHAIKEDWSKRFPDPENAADADGEMGGEGNDDGTDAEGMDGGPDDAGSGNDMGGMGDDGFDGGAGSDDSGDLDMGSDAVDDSLGGGDDLGEMGGELDDGAGSSSGDTNADSTDTSVDTTGVDDNADDSNAFGASDNNDGAMGDAEAGVDDETADTSPDSPASADAGESEGPDLDDLTNDAPEPSESSFAQSKEEPAEETEPAEPEVDEPVEEEPEVVEPEPEVEEPETEEPEEEAEPETEEVEEAEESEEEPEEEESTEEAEAEATEEQAAKDKEAEEAAAEKQAEQDAKDAEALAKEEEKAQKQSDKLEAQVEDLKEEEATNSAKEQAEQKVQALKDKQAKAQEEAKAKEEQEAAKDAEAKEKEQQRKEEEAEKERLKKEQEKEKKDAEKDDASE